MPALPSVSIPPRNPRPSMSIVFAPPRAAASAAITPAVPPPATTTSTGSSTFARTCCTYSPPGCNVAPPAFSAATDGSAIPAARTADPPMKSLLLIVFPFLV